MNYTRNWYSDIMYIIRDSVKIVAFVVLDTKDKRPIFPIVQDNKHFSRFEKSQYLTRQWVKRLSHQSFV